ncbi:hypothetical protein [Sporomusa sp. GT1]|uniref:hypothetical protein n=1 Tax=Sporomusa sp. GT1 TaxID=1534747 RepID=UPI001CB82F18|nr:hypothetical protein [Sporomusa sp. GT1]
MFEITLFCGSTTSEDGAIPKEHHSLAPPHTHIPIGFSPFACGFCSSGRLWFTQPACLPYPA